MPGLSENDYVQAGWELDDLNVESHQFEKAECQGTRDAEPQADEIRDMEAASDAKFDGEVEVLKKTLTVAAIAVRRRDTFRSAGGTFQYREIIRMRRLFLWQDMRLQDVETKPLDGKIPYQRRSSRVRSLLGRRRADAGAVFEETVPFSGDVGAYGVGRRT